MLVALGIAFVVRLTSPATGPLSDDDSDGIGPAGGEIVTPVRR